MTGSRSDHIPFPDVPTASCLLIGPALWSLIGCGFQNVPQSSIDWLKLGLSDATVVIHLCLAASKSKGGQMDFGKLDVRVLHRIT